MTKTNEIMGEWIENDLGKKKTGHGGQVALEVLSSPFTSRTLVRIPPGDTIKLIGFSVPTRSRGFSLEYFSGVFLPHLKLKLPSLSSLNGVLG